MVPSHAVRTQLGAAVRSCLKTARQIGSELRNDPSQLKGRLPTTPLQALQFAAILACSTCFLLAFVSAVLFGALAVLLAVSCCLGVFFFVAGWCVGAAAFLLTGLSMALATGALWATVATYAYRYLFPVRDASKKMETVVMEPIQEAAEEAALSAPPARLAAAPAGKAGKHS